MGETTEEVETEAEVGGIASDRLRSVIERYERLDEEVKALRDHQKDILKEGESAGFDVKVLRDIIAIRKRDPDEQNERENLLDLYRRALGM